MATAGESFIYRRRRSEAGKDVYVYCVQADTMVPGAAQGSPRLVITNSDGDSLDDR